MSGGAHGSPATSGANSSTDLRTATGLFTSIGVALALMRVGTVAGLWPVLVGADGLETANLMPYLLHLLGAIATVVVVAMHRRIMRLIAIAFTGYSTVALGLGAPGAVGVIIWITGIAALVGVLLAALRPDGVAARWAWVTGSALALVGGVALSILGAR